MLDDRKNNSTGIIICILLIVAVFLCVKMFEQNGNKIYSKHNSTETQRVKHNNQFVTKDEFNTEIEILRKKISYLESKIKNFEGSNSTTMQGNELVDKQVKGSNAHIISFLTSPDFRIRKSVFENVLRIYQRAFCENEIKTVPLPKDLFEKLSSAISGKGPSGVAINEFINANYKNIPNNQKIAIQETFEGMNEIGGEIRQWDISKVIIAHGILVVNRIDYTKENLQKSQSCMNGKTSFEAIAQDFYKQFGIPQSETISILTALCGNKAWFGQAQSDFAQKFMEYN